MPVRAEVAKVHQAGELDKLSRDHPVFGQKYDADHKDKSARYL